MNNEEFEQWYEAAKYETFEVPEEYRKTKADCFVGYQAATASKQREIYALNQQVLELSAQVEAMREALLNLSKLQRGDVSAPLSSEVFRQVDSVLSLTPPAALEAHDNEVAAKALEEAAAWAENCGEWLPDSTFTGLARKFKDMAAELRSKK